MLLLIEPSCFPALCKPESYWVDYGIDRPDHRQPMTTLIALLRGINVGGNNPLPMKELSALLTGMGLRDVQTYIQSGNVVFRCELKNKATLAAKITAAIKGQHGFAPHVLLLETAELKKAMAGNPYPVAEPNPKSLHLFFLDEAPQHPDLKALDAFKTDSERYELVGKVFYLHAPDGVGNSKLAARAENLLGVAATARNWNTVCKLAEMVIE
jgi:uncharacterized protein (DUF1697 family)